MNCTLFETYPRFLPGTGQPGDGAFRQSPFSPFSPSGSIRASAIILAAGFSSRMGGFKPLMPLPSPEGERPALDILLESYFRIGVHDIVVVSGYRGDEVDARARQAGTLGVRNLRPEDGMFSSVLLGLAHLPERCTHIFIHPVDVPLVRLLSLRCLLVAAEAHPNAVCVPVFDGKSGHPPLLPATPEVIRGLFGYGNGGSLRLALSSLPRVDVPVPDSLMPMDMDTNADYVAMRERARRIDLLSPEEASALMRIGNIPQEIRKHCLAVGAVGRTLALALQTEGPSHLPDDVLSGGLTHDIAKGLPRHDKAAGNFFRENALPGMADMVEDHMDLEMAKGGQLSERELVFLADKYVCGTRPVPLEERYRKKLELFAAQSNILAAVRERLERAKSVERHFMLGCGRDPFDLARTALPDAGADEVETLDSTLTQRGEKKDINQHWQALPPPVTTSSRKSC